MIKNNRKMKFIIKILLILLVVFTMLINPIITNAEENTQISRTVTQEIRRNVAMWYLIARYFSIAAMLSVLVYLGIRLAISTVASQKALYKRMLVDWFTGFIMIFAMHYFMKVILYLNETLLGIIRNVEEARIAARTTEGEVGETIYETIRTRAYSLKFTVGTSGAIMYIYLVYYTIKYLIIYIRRYVNVIILTITAPIIAMLNTFKKIKSGRSDNLTKWFEEYMVNVFIQSVHALVYVICVGFALEASEENFMFFIIALVALHFMPKADKLFRKIFKLSGNSPGDDVSVKDAIMSPFKATKAVMAGGAMKEITDVSKRKAQKYIGKGIDKHLEKKLDKKREQLDDSEYAKKAQRRKQLQDEIDKEMKERAKNTKDFIENEGFKKKSKEEREQETRGGKLTNKELAEKYEEKKKLDKELEKYNNIKHRYTEVDENGKVRTIRRDVRYDEYGKEKKRSKEYF